jgi:RNA polymerase sigma-70 factor (ECF subfamily)
MGPAVTQSPPAPPEIHSFAWRRRRVLLNSTDTLSPPGPLPQIWQECVDAPGDASKWAAFLTAFYPTIVRIARNIARIRGESRPECIDDVVQSICLALSEKASQLRGRASAAGAPVEAYLKQTAANAACDWFRVERRHREAVPIELDTGQLCAALTIPSRLDREVLLRQIEDAVEASDRDRGIFFLYFRDGWTAAKIASIPAVGLSESGVEAVIGKLTRMIREKLGVSAKAAHE